MPRKRDHSHVLGKTFVNKQGKEFAVVEFVGTTSSGNSLYRCQFLESGASVVCKRGHIENSAMKDPWGLSALGGKVCKTSVRELDGPYFSKALELPDKHEQRIRNAYTHITERCLNPNCPSYSRYGAVGVTICDRWRWRQYFTVDAMELPNFEKYIDSPLKGGYQLDKDLGSICLYNGSKYEYSPDTCHWLSPEANQALGAKPVEFEGEIYLNAVELGELLGLSFQNVRFRVTNRDGRFKDISWTDPRCIKKFVQRFSYLTFHDYVHEYYQ